jgi:DNA-binding transcriptional ArsR family regulator
VTVSSIKERGYYFTPEFQNLLMTTKNLRREFSLFEGVDIISSNKFLKSLDALEESLNLHFKNLYELEGALDAAMSLRLTSKQRRLLRWLVEDYKDEMVYTTLIEKISEDMDIPRSTVRWNLRGLRDAELITAGDRENKGMPLRLTKRGEIVANLVAVSGA